MIVLPFSINSVFHWHTARFQSPRLCPFSLDMMRTDLSLHASLDWFVTCFVEYLGKPDFFMYLISLYLLAGIDFYFNGKNIIYT
jgi:hypothetical protein